MNEDASSVCSTSVKAKPAARGDRKRVSPKKMKITVTGLGGKHELDVAEEETVRAVKAKIEPLAGLTIGEIKLIFKGKSPDDEKTCRELGLSDGAKLMLMRSKEGAKQAANKAATTQGIAPLWLRTGARVLYVGSEGAAQPAVVRAVHTDDPPSLYCTIVFDDGSERQTPVDRLRELERTLPSSAAAAPAEAGTGSVELRVAHGKEQLVLRCEAATVVSELKALLHGLTGAEASGMRLLSKGKEAAEGQSVQDLGLAPAGGRLMLLFRERHHKEAEGAAAVASCAGVLAALSERIGKARQRMKKRLLTGAEALATLGQLGDEVAVLRQDLVNAKPNESSDAARARKADLATCEALQEQLEQARKEEAAAELAAQR
jgi:hypothetical protein